jgi:hypothetical protein
LHDRLQQFLAFDRLALEAENVPRDPAVRTILPEQLLDAWP